MSDEQTPSTRPVPPAGWTGVDAELWNALLDSDLTALEADTFLQLPIGMRLSKWLSEEGRARAEAEGLAAAYKRDFEAELAGNQALRTTFGARPSETMHGWIERLSKAEQENARLRELLRRARPKHYPGECGRGPGQAPDGQRLSRVRVAGSARRRARRLRVLRLHVQLQRGGEFSMGRAMVGRPWRPPHHRGQAGAGQGHRRGQRARAHGGTEQ